MSHVKLVWASNSPEWEDVHCKADSVVIEGGEMRVRYSGDTEDGGRYEGLVEIALREGVQTIEGEYTVHSPKGPGDSFTQVVTFGLTGQIKPLAAGGHYFYGIWDESGVAQEFSVTPVTMPGSTAAVRSTDRSFQIDELPYKAVPAAAQAPVKAIRAFQSAINPLRLQIGEIAAFAEFKALFDKFDAVIDEAKGRMDDLVTKTIEPTSLTDYLRDEASLAIEQLLDIGASVTTPEAYPESLTGFVADIESLSENINDAIMRAGYELCRVWIGVEQAE